MKYIVKDKKDLDKAEKLYNSFPEKFKLQIDYIEMHSFGTILMVVFKRVFSNKIILPSNLNRITIKNGTLETFLTDVSITAEIEDVSKLEIVFDKNITL